MAKILILNQVFPPDRVSSGDIFADLALDLRHRGHSLTVLTTKPHFNEATCDSVHQPLSPVWGPLLLHSNFHGIPVLHTFMPRKSARLSKRIFGWAGFHLVSIAAGIKLLEPPDVILVVSPPLTIGLVGWFLAKWHRAKYLYNVQELYPDLAVSLGVIRSRALIRCLEVIERFVYVHAAAVTVIGPRIGEQIARKNLSGVNIELIPNPVDVGVVRPASKDNDFSRRHAIENKFVVLYAGNLGPAQQLETFVYAAHLLGQSSDIHFLMMGTGTGEQALRRRVLDLQLENLIFLPYQNPSLMNQIYAAADLCLVPLASGIGKQALPSKVYRIMAAGRAVLAISESDSDLALLVRDAACGWTIVPGDPTALADCIRSAADDPSGVRARGLAGRQYVVENNSRERITDLYCRLLVAGASERSSTPAEDKECP